MSSPQIEHWQILDVGSIWMKEFAAALSRTVPTVAWVPKMTRTGIFEDWERVEQLQHPVLETVEFPMQRGYARAPLRWMAPFEKKILKRMHGRTGSPERSALICTTPFYAPVAEQWPGPVVYYSTDLTAEYEGIDGLQVRDLDRRMCRVARAVCPNSRRIADYFVREAGCDPLKITVVPNATRETNVAPAPLLEPGELPEDVRDLGRPIVGVLGDLSGNMDWALIEGAVDRTPELHWIFVGPTSRAIQDPAQRAARERVMDGRGRFVGAKPYGELQRYARCVDAAVLPYKKKEPTFSGSSTRFYEHVAACRPMLATRGFAELMEKPPLLVLVDTVDETVAELGKLAAVGFRDGQETARWEASRVGTWEERARTLRGTLERV